MFGVFKFKIKVLIVCKQYSKTGIGKNCYFSAKETISMSKYALWKIIKQGVIESKIIKKVVAMETTNYRNRLLLKLFSVTF